MLTDRFRTDYIAKQISLASDEATAQELLQKVGIRTNSEPIEAVQEAMLVEEAAIALNDPLFGIRAGLAFRETTTITGYVARTSKTLERAILNARKANKAIFPAYDYALIISGNSASFRFRAVDERLSKFHRHVELLVFGVLSFLRTLALREFYPLEIRIPHEARGLTEEFQSLAGFAVVFGAEELEILLPLSVLEMPIATYDSKLLEHLNHYSQILLAERPDPNPSLRARIEGVLIDGLPDRIPTSDVVAASLGMSGRTMARHLKEDGLSFREILDDLRLCLAKTYLNGGTSVTEVAFLLGYSDTASFSNAFKRWTGLSPRRFAIG